MDSRPPLTDKGGSQLPTGQNKSNVSLDWITCVYHNQGNYASREVVDISRVKVLVNRILAGYDLADWSERVKNLPGYDTTYKLASGGTVSWHSNMPKQGIMINWSGHTLLSWELIDRHEIIGHMAKSGFKFTRIDIAYDTYHEKLPDLTRCEYDIKTRLGFSGMYVSMANHPEDGQYKRHTMYLGSRKSLRRLRIYEKSGQLKNWDNGYMVRLEIVLRKKFAERVAQAIIQNGLLDAATASINELISGSSIDWITELLKGDYEIIAPLGRKDTDTMKWVNSTVLPLLDNILEDGNEDLLNALIGMIERHG